MGANKLVERRKVNKLPVNAVTVAAYAKEWPCNTAYIYKLDKLARDAKKSLVFEIVDFQGINFVIPK